MTQSLSPQQAARRDWISLLAVSPAARISALLREPPPYEPLRGPEIGAVMARGRQGGSGAPFNLGEVAAVRASVRLASGEVGHALVQGRDKAHALAAALIDALMQTEAASRIEAEILAPLRAEREAARAERAAKAAATRVEFFTLARGEDE